MSAGTLLLDATLATATSLLYLHVGMLTLRRPANEAAGRHALRLFALWWFGLAAVTLLGVAQTGLAAMGRLDNATYRAMTALYVLPLVAIFWGLVSYLGYIYTGSPKVFRPVALFHAAVLAYLLYVVAGLEPRSITMGTWRMEVDHGDRLGPGVTRTILALILLPALAAALGYASLYFRTRDRSARFRIAMVSGAFLVWLGSAGVAALTSLARWEYWPPTSRTIALLSTLMVLAAYRPPRWARERFGLRSTDPRRAERDVERAWLGSGSTRMRGATRAGGSVSGASGSADA